MPDVIWYTLLSATVERQVHQEFESPWSRSQGVRTGVPLDDSGIVEVDHLADERVGATGWVDRSPKGSRFGVAAPGRAPLAHGTTQV
jgi:hypothetical protein